MTSRGFRLRSIVSGLVCLSLAGCGPAPTSPAADATPIERGPTSSVRTAAKQVALRPSSFFVENRGQLPETVAYYLHGRNASVFLKPGGMWVNLTQAPPSQPEDTSWSEPRLGSTWAIGIDFAGANPGSRPSGRDETPTTVNYLTGTPDSWQSGLPTYAAVAYMDLWPGIDFTFATVGQTLKYEASVHPGADPADIQLVYRGVESVQVSPEGALISATPLGRLVEAAPVVYQLRNGRRQTIPAAYSVRPSQDGTGFAVSFDLGAYDPTLDLIVDPAVLVYAGYLGGVGADTGHDIVVGANGNLYVGGYTTSTQDTFPTAVGPDVTANGGQDAFVAKLDASGTTLLYATFLGGSDAELLYGLAVDASGNAFVTGETRSSDGSFPVVNGPDLTYNGGFRDGFVAEINSTGSAFVYSGFIGGSGDDASTSLALDAVGNAYLTGFTTSTQATFPVTGGPDLTHNGTGAVNWGDVFVAKVNPTGSGLVYAGYIGGSADEAGMGIAVDSDGRAYVTGRTESSQTSFPVAVGPDLSYNGGSNGDAFVARVAANGGSLDYAGYIGGAGTDGGSQVAAAADGTAYVSGVTQSDAASFPVLVGPDLTFNGVADSFIAHINATGSALLYAGYIGGAGEEAWTALAVDATGYAYVAGSTKSGEASFPVGDGTDPSYNGLWDGFVGRVNVDGSAFTEGGYIGGIGDDSIYDVALSSHGGLWVAGQTTSTETSFPDGDGFGGLPGRDQSQNGSEDVLLAKATFHPAASGTVFLPVAIRTYCSGFMNGGAELEPNNTGATANGPLCSGASYAGTAGDTYDIFYFDSAAGSIALTLANHVGQGVQLILYYQQLDAAHEVIKDSSGPDYQIRYSGGAGRYYISVFTASGFDALASYRLDVVHP